MQMRTHTKRILAFVSCFVMIITSVFTVWVDSSVVNAQENIDILGKDLVNYVTVDSSEQTLESTQVITVGVGNGELDLRDASISYINETTGEEYTACATNRTKDSFVFEFGFAGCNEGVYKLENMIYKLDNEYYSLSFADAGFDVVWGVGVYVESNCDARAVPDETSDESYEDGVVYTVQTDDASYTSSELSEAMYEASASLGKNNEKGRAGNGDIMVVLDPGHGGSDSGACANGLVEKELTLRVAEVCQFVLSGYNGVQVAKTRDDDRDVSLEGRIYIAQLYNADMFISIHFNSGSGNPRGAEVYYPNGNYNFLAAYCGYIMAERIQSNLVSLGLADRGTKVRNSENGTLYPNGELADYYSVIRNGTKVGIPSIIVEHAFLQGDAGLLHNDDFVVALGVADANAIIDNYGLQPKGRWNPYGFYTLNHSWNNYYMGMCVSNKDRDLDYRWLAYEYATGCWCLISDWKTNDEWMSWNPGKSGDYLIRCEIRETYNQSVCAEFTGGTRHFQLIKGICQIPNPYGAGALVGMETHVSSPEFRYEISILDCSKLGTSTPWIFGTGIVSSDKALWATPNISKGYYWTLYRLYDTNGNLIDELCYGFENI